MASKLLVLVAVMLPVLLVHAQDKSNYVIVAPKVIRPGLPFKMSLSVTDQVTSETFEVSIKDRKDKSDLTDVESVSLAGGESVTISLDVPSEASSQYDLYVRGSGDVRFEETQNLELEHKSSMVFIQTDKAVYKPGALVLFRVVSVNPELKPHMTDMDITIEDPMQNKLFVKTIGDEDTTKGVYSSELQLTDRPPLGKWIIKVSAEGAESEKSFKVEEYVLPKYEVKVETQTYYLPSDGNLPVTVTAKYTYGQPVRGTVTIKYGKNKVKTAELVDGSYSLVISKQEVTELWCNNYPRSCPERIPDDFDMTTVRYMSDMTLQIEANVTETLTGKTFEEMASCTLTTKELHATIVGPDTFKSEMPYDGMIEFKSPDGGPPRSLLDAEGNLLDKFRDTKVTLKVSLSFNRQITEDDGTTVTEQGTKEETLAVPLVSSGRMPFSYNVAEKFESIDFNLNFENAGTSKSIEEFKSRSDQSLKISLPGVTGVVKEDFVTVNVKSSVPITKINIVVISKGGIVKAFSEQFNSRQEYTFDLSVDKAVWSPSARILAYTITESDDEILPDSVEFDIDGVFSNEVSLAFSKSEAEPGDDIRLNVQASPQSFVGLLAVDKSVLLLGSGNDITREEVLDGLASFDSAQNDNPTCFNCDFIGRKKRSAFWGPWFPGVEGTDAASLFQAAGINVITDAYVHEEQDYTYEDGCPNCGGGLFPMVPERLPDVDFDYNMGGMVPADDNDNDNDNKVSSGSSAPAPVARTEFPETWLWTDEVARSDGTVSISTKVPDTITSWVATAFAVHNEDGLGVSESPATVTVSKDFFVSLTLPYSVIRGEKFKLQILVFNYKSQPIEAKVSLDVTEQFDVPDFKGNKWETNVKVPSNDGESVKVWILPKILGNIKLKVTVMSGASADAVERQLLVEAEGVQESYSESKLVELENGRDTLTFNAELPDVGFVPGSEYITLTVVGDMMGPSINGLESLIKMPYGCGEQNMISFAPNIYALNYLEAVNQDDSEIRSNAIKYMNEGVQRQLNYMHTDNSFSAFGMNDESGSTWLSAFVVRTFHQASKYIYVDEEVMLKTLRWLSKQGQKSRTTWPEPGRVIHTEMQGGTGEGLGLTAFVVLAFLENHDMAIKNGWMPRVDLALDYLVSELDKQTDPLTVSLITYALHVAGSSRSDQALSAYKKLMSMKTEKDGWVYWEKKKDEDEDEKDFDALPFWCRYTDTTSSTIEMTAYALLTMAKRVNLGLADVTEGLPVAKFLASQRNERGGFRSTQDTVTALMALSEFTQMVNTDDQNIDVTVVAGSQQHTFQTITRDSAMLLQELEISVENGKNIQVICEGQGSALVQMNVQYNVKEGIPIPGVDITVDSQTNQMNDVVTTEICARWTKGAPSGMAVMELNMLSAHEAIEPENLLIKYREKGLKRIDVQNEKKLVFYLDQLTQDYLCMNVNSQPIVEVEDLQEASAVAYSYYSPQVQTVKTYLPHAMREGETDQPPEPSLGNRAVVSMATVIMSAIVAMVMML